MQAEVKAGKLILTFPIPKTPPLSKSGKTRLVATTGGFQETSVTVAGHPVKVSLNATIPL